MIADDESYRAERHVAWRPNVGDARGRLTPGDRLAMLYLTKPACRGSAAMGRHVFGDPVVRDAIARWTEPVLLDQRDDPDLEDAWVSGWTPTFVFLDVGGREHRRSEGFLDATRLIGEIALARVNAAVDDRDWQRAEPCLRDAWAATEADPVRHAETMYWAAIVAFRLSGDRASLNTGWEALGARHPDSAWTHKASYPALD